MYDVVLFDLDGTITDSGLGITNSVRYALNRYSIEVRDNSELECFIGPPLNESFEKFYGFTKEEASNAVSVYREYYREKGIYENLVYDGIEKLLREIRDKGKTAAVATSKPELFARQILDHFGLSEYFAYIGGANMNETRTDKAEVIDYVLDELKITDKSKVVMVGDREHDIIGARKNGLDSIGVLFGYGSREELENAEATHIAPTVEDIYPIIFP